MPARAPLARMMLPRGTVFRTTPLAAEVVTTPDEDWATVAPAGRKKVGGGVAEAVTRQTARVIAIKP